MRVVPDLTLSRRLLSSIAFAPFPQQLDSPALAEAVGARPRSVNATLARMAEDGLLEGLWTGERWTRLQLTPRGLARAPRVGTPPAAEPNGPSTLSTSIAAAREQFQPVARATSAAIVGGLRAVPPAMERLRGEAAPRAAAIRGRAAATYRLFTNFP
jgi:hypothetical protein